MKRFKQLVAVLLLLIMCFSITACGGENDDPSGTDSRGIVDPVIRPEEMSGKDFIIIQHQPEISPFGYAENSQLAERAFKRMEDVEALYGCTLNFSTVPYDNNFVTQIQAFAYEENSGDLIFSSNNAMLRRCVGTGGDDSMLVSLLPYDSILDFWNTEKWGNITAKETMMYGKDFYGVTPALWINYLPLPYYYLVYNRDLLESFGQTDLQEYYENGTWTRDVMMDIVISCYDDTGAVPIYGMAAHLSHMIRASFLAAGCTPVQIDSINVDGTSEWTNGWLLPEAEEALTWLQGKIKSNPRCFNGGKNVGTWSAHEGFIAQEAVMCLTSPITILNNIVVDAAFSYGIMPWGGFEPNYMSGYYENVCTVAIPTFAQNAEWSAFLMADLFEGLDGTPDYNSVLEYYRNTYFDTDTDMEILIQQGSNNLQYSYWPNNGDATLGAIAGSFLSSSVTALLQANAGLVDSVVETYILPNKIALEQYKAEGKY